jgi:hypothetical protein
VSRFGQRLQREYRFAADEVKFQHTERSATIPRETQ